MAYNKKDLQALKKKLKKENPGVLRPKKKSVIKKAQRVEGSNFEPQKKVVQWNYDVNDLVKYKYSDDIGIIVADKQFFGKKIEKNYFYVLVGNSVMKIDGQHIRKL